MDLWEPRPRGDRTGGEHGPRTQSPRGRGSHTRLNLMALTLQRGNAVLEALASDVKSSWSLQGKGSHAGAWELGKKMQNINQSTIRWFFGNSHGDQQQAAHMPLFIKCVATS